eukprot:scaffold6230_cov127-Isochrysis_galbana.AAC.14
MEKTADATGKRGHRKAPHYTYRLLPTTTTTTTWLLWCTQLWNHPPAKSGLNKEKGWGRKGKGEGECSDGRGHSVIRRVAASRDRESSHASYSNIRDFFFHFSPTPAPLTSYHTPPVASRPAKSERGQEPAGAGGVAAHGAVTGAAVRRRSS